MDGFLSMLLPGAFVAGLDFEDCFLRWLASHACRRLLGVRSQCPAALASISSCCSAWALPLDGTTGARRRRSGKLAYFEPRPALLISWGISAW